MAQKTAIVYFSHTGNTKFVAEYLAQILNATVIPLVDHKGLEGNAVNRHEFSDLAGDPWQAVSAYDRLIIMAPVWSSGVVPAMYTFLEKGVFTEKNIIIGLTNLWGKLSAAPAALKYAIMIEKTGGKVIGEFYLKGGFGKPANEIKLQQRVEKVLPAIQAM